MGLLRDADLARLHHVVHALDPPVARAELPHQVMDLLQHLLPCEVVCYHEIGQRSADHVFGVLPGDAMPPSQHEVFQAHLDRHPLVEYVRRTGDLHPVRFTDVTSAAELRRVGVYSEFFQPLGLHHQMAFSLPTPPGTLVGFEVNRTRTDFTDEERLLADLARAHLTYVFRAAEARAWLDAALIALDRGTPTTDGVVLLGPLGEARIVNRAAHRLLSRYFRRPAHEGAVVPEELTSWMAAQRGLHRPVPYIAARPGGRLVVRLISDGHSGALLLTETGAPAPTGLTPRETEVLTLAGDGLTSAQIGRRLGISLRTVNKHVENILAKLQVPSRTAAVRKAFGHRPAADDELDHGRTSPEASARRPG